METMSSKGLPFPTTLGFSVQRNWAPVAEAVPPPNTGAEVGLGHVGASAHLAMLPPISTARRITSLHGAATLAAHPAPSPKPAAPPSSPLPTADVGWQGLLEISRTSGASGVLGCKASVDEELAKDTKIEICCTAHTSPSVRRLVKSVIRGLKACQDPERANEGMGGTYFFSNENGRKVAIMKPCDEEPLAPNNPKGYVGRSLGEPGWKPTVRVGEAAMREVAAYLLDKDGWARVPTSVLVRARHPIFCYNNRMSSVRQSSLDLATLIGPNGPTANQLADVDGGASPTSNLPMKLGSLQEFVSHMCDTSEMGPSRFCARDVHRIGILDIRLFNTDRHAGNMLVRHIRQPTSTTALGKVVASSIMSEPLYELIPIDHGFCLPETLEACYFEWLHWPQAMLPFTEDELKYIAEINIEADKELLRKELPNLRPECLRVMELSTTLLQRGAEAGLTLFDIATVMTRPFEGGAEEPSELERTAAAAKQAMEDMDSSHGCDDVIEEGESEEGSDCSSSAEEVGDSDCEAAGFDDGDEDDEEVMDALKAAGVGQGRRNNAAIGSAGGVALDDGSQVPSMETKTSSRAEDSMLFDLDDDMLNGAAPATPMMSVRSPLAASLGSSLSSGDEFSFGMTASLLASSGTPVTSGGDSASRLGDGNGKPVGILGGGVGGGPAAAMASSVHVTGGGFLWRRAHHARSTAAAKRPGLPKHAATARGVAGKPSPRSPVPYPPPVVAFAPECLNGLFRDMDEVQWERFMSVWLQMLDAILSAGRWKQSLARDTPVAQSCPRF